MILKKYTYMHASQFFDAVLRQRDVPWPVFLAPGQKEDNFPQKVSLFLLTYRSKFRHLRDVSNKNQHSYRPFKNITITMFIL